MRKVIIKISSLILGLSVSGAIVFIGLFYELLLNIGSSPFSLVNSLVFGFFWLLFFGIPWVVYWLSPYVLAWAFIWAIASRYEHTAMYNIGEPYKWLCVAILSGVSAELVIIQSSKPSCPDSISSWSCLLVRSLYEFSAMWIISVIALAGLLGGVIYMYLKRYNNSDGQARRSTKPLDS